MTWNRPYCSDPACGRRRRVVDHVRTSRRHARAGRVAEAAFFALQAHGEAATCPSGCGWPTVTADHAEALVEEARVSGAVIPWSSDEIITPAISADESVETALAALGDDILDEKIPPALLRALFGGQA